MQNHLSFSILPESSFNKVDIKKIENSKKWSLHPFLSSNLSPKVLASIQRVGLLHPPIILQTSTDKYQLLCGYSRLEAYKRTNPSKTSITCLILDKDTSSEQILHTVLEDQLLSGSLSSIEKAYFFKYSLNYIEINEAAKNYLPILNEKIQPHTIKKFFRLLELEQELQISIHFGRINDKTAQELLSLTSSDRLTLHNIFLNLELGGGKQKRLLGLSKDLAYREGQTITELLSGSDCKEILTHSEMNQPQKISNLLTSLQKRLYPQSNSAEEVFLKKVHNMDLPASCSLTHSQAFEGDEVSLTIHFKDLLNVEKKLAEIKNIVKN